jgi:hypothetical protein
MSWSTNEKEEITFTTGEYRITFDPTGNKPDEPSNVDTIYTLLRSIRYIPFKNKIGYCFALALIRLAGKDHVMAHYELHSLTKHTLTQYNTYWNYFTLFLVEEPTNHNLFNNPYQLTSLLRNFLVWLIVGDTVHCTFYTLPQIKLICISPL